VSAQEKNSQESGHDHNRGKQLSHGQSFQNESELSVRFSEKFKRESKYSIEKKKKGNHHPIRKRFLAKEPQQSEKDSPFHEGFIQLGWVTRERSAPGENHCPGNVCDPAVEFGVNEVADPAEAKADGSRHNDAVCYSPEGQFLSLAKPPPCNNTAYKAAVKGHAAVPDGDDFEGMAEIIGPVGILVEKHIAEACTCHEADGQLEDQILNKGSCEPDRPYSLLAPDEIVPCDESEAVHDAVPSNMKWADSNQVRIDARVRNHSFLHYYC
jgi:hypothetical protein